MPAVGQSVPRIDGPDKVTGRARYSADIIRPGMLWARVLRSPLPHARIRSIDTSRARALPGVFAVLTGGDFPDVRVGRCMADMPVLAVDRVCFVGEKVAAVAAIDRETAEEALQLVQVEYEELPAVFEPLDAMREDAPLIHEDTEQRKVPGQVVPPVPNGVSEHSWGVSQDEVEAAFMRSDRVFEHTFRAPVMHQAYLEPNAYLVEVEDGRVHLWASQKMPFLLRERLEIDLGIPQESVEHQMAPLGGDFGAKGAPMDIPLVYLLARATGRPVKLVNSSSEELMASNPRHSAEVTLRTGVTREGRLIARHMRVIYNGGAYAAHRPDTRAPLPAASSGLGYYRIPVARMDFTFVYTNTAPRGFMRGPGAFQTYVFAECQLDLIARDLGIDPLQLRLLNLAAPGEPMGINAHCHSPHAREVLEIAARELSWDSPRPAGKGRAIVLQEVACSAAQYSAEVVARPDGRAALNTPIVDCGPGAHTALAQITADELGYSMERLDVVTTIDGLPRDTGPSGARVTRLSGEAARQAARAVRERVLEAAAEALGVPAGELRIEDGVIRSPDGRHLDAGEAVRFSGGEIREQAKHLPEAPGGGQAFVAHGAEVTLDHETGQIRVDRLVAVHDAGIVVNPVLHQGQIEGGIIQGLGYTLMEELVLEDGRPINCSLGEYRIPANPDVPRLTTILLKADREAGIKPASEGHNSAAAAVIACAVQDATGVLPTRLPLTAERVRASLRREG